MIDYHRRSIRLKGFDYANGGYYFVTIDVQNKIKLLWNENDDEGRNRNNDEGRNRNNDEGRTHRSARTDNQSAYISNPGAQKSDRINEIGSMVAYWWREIANHFHNVSIDEYVIMPDHMHGIIKINSNNMVGVDRCVDPIKLGNIIQWFKILSTNRYIDGVKNNNWPRFDHRLWQRNYFEIIIKDKMELDRIRHYIINNPIKLGKIVGAG